MQRAPEGHIVPGGRADVSPASLDRADGDPHCPRFGKLVLRDRSLFGETPIPL